jgi:hypothetical protein
MQRDDLKSLLGCLLWGSPSARRELGDRLAADGSGAGLALLAETARSRESWRLRARCLEVLGIAAGQADQATAEHILQLLVPPTE